MTSLKDLVTASGTDNAVADMATFITTTVDKQSGLSGMAIKGALGAAKKVDSDIVAKGSRRLLPELLDGLDPLWQDFQAAGSGDFGAYLEANQKAATDAILAVADRNADSISVPALGKVYQGVRGKAVKVIEGEVGEIGRLVQRHAS